MHWQHCRRKADALSVNQRSALLPHELSFANKSKTPLGFGNEDGEDSRKSRILTSSIPKYRGAENSWANPIMELTIGTTSKGQKFNGTGRSREHEQFMKPERGKPGLSLSMWMSVISLLRPKTLSGNRSIIPTLGGWVCETKGPFQRNITLLLFEGSAMSQLQDPCYTSFFKFSQERLGGLHTELQKKLRQAGLRPYTAIIEAHLIFHYIALKEENTCTCSGKYANHCHHNGVLPPLYLNSNKAQVESAM